MVEPQWKDELHEYWQAQTWKGRGRINKAQTKTVLIKVDAQSRAYAIATESIMQSEW